MKSQSSSLLYKLRKVSGFGIHQKVETDKEKRSKDEWWWSKNQKMGIVFNHDSMIGLNPWLPYDLFNMPMIRKVMPNLLAYDIIGVQPMSGPTGQIFSMRYSYGSDLGGNNTAS